MISPSFSHINHMDNTIEDTKLSQINYGHFNRPPNLINKFKLWQPMLHIHIHYEHL
jgi:hypothetical protein